MVGIEKPCRRIWRRADQTVQQRLPRCCKSQQKRYEGLYAEELGHIGTLNA